MSKKVLSIGSAVILICIAVSMLGMKTGAQTKVVKEKDNNQQSQAKTGLENMNLNTLDDKENWLNQIYQTKAAGAYQDIRELPQNYKYEDAVRDNCYINSIFDNTKTNRKLYNEFNVKLKNKQTAFIRVVQTTVEGDLVIADVLYDSKSDRIYLVKDDTRDRYLSLAESIISIRQYAQSGEWEDSGERSWILYNKHPDDIDLEQATVQDYFFLDVLK